MALEASADLSIFARLAPGNLHLVNWDLATPVQALCFSLTVGFSGNSFR